MREIINLQIGQCGNNMGLKFWQTIAQEHGLELDGTIKENSDQQMQRLNVYYHEGSHKRYMPRSICIDLDPGTVDYVQASSIGRLIPPENFITGNQGAGNNWAKGYYTEGGEIIDTIKDQIRKEVEKCDCFQGVQITHALGGGTGSGLASLVVNNFVDEHPDKIMQAFPVYPSEKVSDVVVEPYNVCLSYEILNGSWNSILQAIDNEALYDLCVRDLGKIKPTYGDLNHLFSGIMSGVTASLRFPGQLNSDLRKMLTNLIPFARQRSVISSHAPLNFRTSTLYKSHSISDMVQQLFDPKNSMCSVNPSSGKIMTGSVLFRGPLQTSEVEQCLFDVQDKNKTSYVNWLSNHLQSSYCNIAPPGKETSATLMLNSTAITQLFQRIRQQFSQMFRRKAFVHWYTAEGMDEMEFTENESYLNDAISGYIMYDNEDNVNEEYYEDEIDLDGDIQQQLNNYG